MTKLDYFIDRYLVPVAYIALIVVFFALMVVALIGIHRAATQDMKADRAFWNGAQVYRICPSGVHIYSMPDGRYVTGWKVQVKNPDEVCARL